MKRLLAKPAPPYAYPHGHSIGSGSESEGFSDSSRQKTLLVDHGTAPPKMGRSRSLQSLLDYRKERQLHVKKSRLAPLPLPPNLEEDRLFGSGPAQTLKNEVDAGTEEYVISVTDEKGKKVNARASSSRVQKTPPTGSEATSDTSTSLTPAAAVVAAYKRQENLHKTLPITRSSIDVDGGASLSEYGQLRTGKKIKKRPYTSSGHGRSATESQPHISGMGSKHASNEEDGGNYPPYYTVFGTSSDHVVAAGGPKDRNHLSWEIVPPFAFTHKGSEGKDGGGLRTLTRKMSGRFKRAGNGTQSEGEEERRRVSFHTERERGRQSFQERSRTRAVLDNGGLSLRLSIDEFAESKVVAHREEKDTTPTSATRSRGSGTSTPSPSGGGSKIWKLMKRLSTGALREKFVSHEQAPPVPLLPKEYAVPDSIQSFDAKTEVSNTLPITEGFGKAVRKKASVILGVKVTSNCGSPIKPLVPSSPLASQVPTPAIRPSPPMPRPSTTTRSSSPVSSDVASSRFFAGHKHSSMSAHSSTSSLPIEVNAHPPPPLPPSLFYRDSNVGQHIVPPSELGKIHVQSDDGQRHGHGGSEVSLALTSQKDPAIQSPRSQMKLRLVMPTTILSPLETRCEHDDYTIMHTPLDPEMSLSLPPRRPGLPLGRWRRDTYASLTGEVGQDQGGEHEADEVADEDVKEWELLWGRSSNLIVDEKILDSRSGSPLIPSFSAEDPINAFSSKRTSTTSRPNAKPSPSTTSPSIVCCCPSETGYILSPAESLPLPPRPARSPRRPASNPTQSNQHSVSLGSRHVEDH
ncbi:hypothetical protein C0992_005550 [Termitomyces sp. T32_za158]|nr:hypothetical protein C0992_005550 [Termitomyces sp. T32_za158]